MGTELPNPVNWCCARLIQIGRRAWAKYSRDLGGIEQRYPVEELQSDACDPIQLGIADYGSGASPSILGSGVRSRELNCLPERSLQGGLVLVCSAASGAVSAARTCSGRSPKRSSWDA